MPKYWGKQIFSLGSFPRSGSKAKDGEKERRKKERRLKVGNNNGQLCIANATSGGAHKAAWANMMKCFQTESCIGKINSGVMLRMGAMPTVTAKSSKNYPTCSN